MAKKKQKLKSELEAENKELRAEVARLQAASGTETVKKGGSTRVYMPGQRSSNEIIEG
jgi:hypothetical protein